MAINGKLVDPTYMTMAVSIKKSEPCLITIAIMVVTARPIAIGTLIHNNNSRTKNMVNTIMMIAALLHP